MTLSDWQKKSPIAGKFNTLRGAFSVPDQLPDDLRIVFRLLETTI